MDKRTRVLTAMSGGEVDHVPAGFWFHFSGEEAMGEACINAHLKYYKETDLDFVKIMCDGYFPWPIRENIRHAADWKKLEPLREDHPFIREQVQRDTGWQALPYRAHTARYVRQILPYRARQVPPTKMMRSCVLQPCNPYRLPPFFFFQHTLYAKMRLRSIFNV